MRFWKQAVILLAFAGHAGPVNAQGLKAPEPAPVKSPVPAAHIAPHGPMTFRLIDAPKLCTGCDVIVASGDIEYTSAQDFQAFFDFHKTGGKKTYFVVDSPGGSVSAAWEIGRKLRALNASVIAGKVEERVDGSADLTAGRCISMCNSLVISGIERRLAPGTTFGVHQFSTAGETYSNLDNKVTVRDVREQLRFAARWLAFSREMGSDSRLVEAQFSVMSEKVDYIDPETLAQWKITTGPSSSLPKVLRDAGPGAGNVQALGNAIPGAIPGAMAGTRPAAEAQSKPPTASLMPVAAPVRPLAALPQNGDRQWSPVVAEGDWRQINVESQADFAKVSFNCSIEGRGFVQVNLRGIPEARQKEIARQILTDGLSFSGRPVDITQVSIGFGTNFWVKFSLMPDQVNAFVALHGQVSFMPGNGQSAESQKLGLNFISSGFEPMMLKVTQQCTRGGI